MTIAKLVHSQIKSFGQPDLDTVQAFRYDAASAKKVFWTPTAAEVEAYLESLEDQILEARLLLEHAEEQQIKAEAFERELAEVVEEPEE